MCVCVALGHFVDSKRFWYPRNDPVASTCFFNWLRFNWTALVLRVGFVFFLVVRLFLFRCTFRVSPPPFVRRWKQNGGRHGASLSFFCSNLFLILHFFFSLLLLLLLLLLISVRFGLFRRSFLLYFSFFFTFRCLLGLPFFWGQWSLMDGLDWKMPEEVVTEFLPSFTELVFSLAELDCGWLGFTKLYWILNQFYWVLPSFF